MKGQMVVSEEHQSNLKMLRPADVGPTPPTTYDIDFHGKRFLFRLEGHPCGFNLKYVHMAPVENMLPPEIRELMQRSGAVQIADKGKVIAAPVMERHLHVRWWERRFRGWVDWRVKHEANRMRKILVDNLFYDAHADRILSSLTAKS